MYPQTGVCEAYSPPFFSSDDAAKFFELSVSGFFIQSDVTISGLALKLWLNRLPKSLQRGIGCLLRVSMIHKFLSFLRSCGNYQFD